MSSKSVFDEVYSSPSNVFDEVYAPPKKDEDFVKARSRNIGVAATGLAKLHPANLAAEAIKLLGQGESLAEFGELQERIPELMKKFPQAPWENFKGLDKEKYMEALKVASGTFPTVSNIAPIVEEATGAPLTPKTETDKAIDFISQIAGGKGGTIPEKILSGLKGQAAKSTLETAGVPEPASDALSLYYALRNKTAPVNVTKAPKSVAPEQAVKGPPAEPVAPSPPAEIERLPSGLSKPRAMEAKSPQLATINSERQKYAIKQLDKEATQLAKKSVEKHLPLVEDIKAGKDLQGHFDKEFEQLATMAKKYNPTIDITPVSDLFKEMRSKYRGIPSPHKDVVKIKKEIERFIDNPQTGMYNLTKIYRSNNKKQRDIFETSRITGKQQEYSDFLSAFNRAISKSFGNTLPEDSQWMSRFLNTNRDYKKFIDTKTSMRLLEPLLEGSHSSAYVNKLAKDTRLHKKLELAMGKEGAAEVVQLAKDLKGARDSIKNLPKEKVHALDAIFPITFLIPFVKIPAMLFKGAQYSRSLYGYWLSSPAKRVAVENATKAIAEGDVAAYKKATETLQKDIPH